MTSAGPQLLLELPEISSVRRAMSLPRARKNDPSSSKAAAAELEGSGRLEGQLLVVLALVRSYPGRTSKELAAKSHIDRYTVARRLPELRRAGYVLMSSETRMCGAGGRQAHTWQAVNAKGECQ